MGVHRDTDDATGQRTLECFSRGEVGGVWAAKAHRYTETLGRPDDNVGAKLARWGENGQGQRVGGDGNEHAGLMSPFDDCAKVGDRSCCCRVLNDQTEHAVKVSG